MPNRTTPPHSALNSSTATARPGRSALATLLLLANMPNMLAAAEEAAAENESLEEITVTSRRVANDRPAATYPTLATALRFNPRTELQARGLPEGQADITVRGGVFENTGTRIGAVTIFDPQTGHYTAGLPLGPQLLTRPSVALGVDNALGGFNATVASLSYRLNPIYSGGTITAGVGSNNTNYQSVLGSTTSESNRSIVGLTVSATRSEGDGTEANGDHAFRRLNVHGQWRGDRHQSDLVVAYQDKFYGWPGGYTGFSSLPETDDTQTTLVLASHRAEQEAGHWELSAFWRRLVDDYDFDRRTREVGVPGAYDHETEVWGAGIQGSRDVKPFSVQYGVQYSGDRVVESTDLRFGDFNRRRYLSARVVPNLDLGIGRWQANAKAGAAWDWSNRDGERLQPILGLTLDDAASGTHWGLSFVETSQLPGYTALNSSPTGLFAGNAQLDRETSKQWTLDFRQTFAAGDIEVSVFQRQDDDLVDWTYSTSTPFSRRANPVDLRVEGVEILGRLQTGAWQWLAGATWVDKDANYRSDTVNASFYALNYAEARATLGAVWSASPTITLRLDNEYRKQSTNPLRNSSGEAWLSALSLTWQPGSHWRLSGSVDNLGDENFEFFPGTPAVGRQGSLSVSYRF